MLEAYQNPHPRPLPQLETVDFRNRTVRASHRALKSHPERRLPERRIYAQRFDLASAGNRKSLRVDPSTALGAGAPRLLRMTLRETVTAKILSFFKNRQSPVMGEGEGEGSDALQAQPSDVLGLSGLRCRPGPDRSLTFAARIFGRVGFLGRFNCGVTHPPRGIA